MKYAKPIILFLLMHLFDSKSICKADSEQLAHICAYSNESVAKFRKAMVNGQNIDYVSNPGVSFDWPVDLCQFWLSSLYGLRVNPGGVKKMHTGIDMAATKGTLVKSAADGIVTAVQIMPGYGNVVEIEHKSGISTRYAHLDTMNAKLGAKVKLGEKIGTVGATGNVRGADPSHLHFEIIKGGKRVNPLPYLYWSERGYKKLKKSVY